MTWAVVIPHTGYPFMARVMDQRDGEICLRHERAPDGEHDYWLLSEQVVTLPPAAQKLADEGVRRLAEAQPKRGPHAALAHDAQGKRERARMTMPRNLWDAIVAIQAGRAYFNYELNRYVFASEFEKTDDARDVRDSLAAAVAAVYSEFTRSEQMRTSKENVRDVLLALHRMEENARRANIGGHLRAARRHDGGA